MEPDVSYYSCHGFEKHAGLQVAQMLKRSSGEFLLFQVTYQASMQSFDIGSRDPSMKKINGYRGVGVVNLLDI
jgi:hypothetical protein